MNREMSVYSVQRRVTDGWKVGKADDFSSGPPQMWRAVPLRDEHASVGSSEASWERWSGMRKKRVTRNCDHETSCPEPLLARLIGCRA